MLGSSSLVDSGESFALTGISFTPLWLEFVLVFFAERGCLKCSSCDANEITPQQVRVKVGVEYVLDDRRPFAAVENHKEAGGASGMLGAILLRLLLATSMIEGLLRRWGSRGGGGLQNLTSIMSA